MQGIDLQVIAKIRTKEREIKRWKMLSVSFDLQQLCFDHLCKLFLLVFEQNAMGIVVLMFPQPLNRLIGATGLGQFLAQK